MPRRDSAERIDGQLTVEARTPGRQIAYAGGEPYAASQRRDRGRDERAIVRAVAVFLSVAIPIGIVGYAQHVRHTVGFNWLSAHGVLVALSLVIAVAVISSRR